MASQGNPGNLEKREGWVTSEGARVSLLTPPVAEAECQEEPARRAHKAPSSRRKEYIPLHDDDSQIRL